MYDMKILTNLMAKSKQLGSDEVIDLFNSYWAGNLTLEKLGDSLIRSNIKFIYSVAKEYFNRTTCPNAELISEGIAGFCEAIPKYNNLDIKFNTYAVYWVRARISEYIEKNSFHCKVPHNKAQEVRDELKRKKEIEKRNREARLNGGTEEVYEMPRDLEMMMTEMNNCFSLDTKIDDNESTTFADIIECTRASGEMESFELENLKDFINSKIDCLSSIEQVVIRVAFNFYDEEVTFKHVSEQTGIKYNQLATIRDTAINKLRILLKTELT